MWNFLQYFFFTKNNIGWRQSDRYDVSGTNPIEDSWMYFTTNCSTKIHCFFVVVNTIVSLGMECRRGGKEEGKTTSSMPWVKHRNGISSTSNVASCRPVGEARETIPRWDTTEVRHPSRKVAYLMNSRRRYVWAGSMSVMCQRGAYASLRGWSTFLAPAALRKPAANHVTRYTHRPRIRYYSFPVVVVGGNTAMHYLAGGLATWLRLSTLRVTSLSIFDEMSFTVFIFCVILRSPTRPFEFDRNATRCARILRHHKNNFLKSK